MLYAPVTRPTIAQSRGVETRPAWQIPGTPEYRKANDGKTYSYSEFASATEQDNTVSLIECRVAQNGRAYTFPQFQLYYGNNAQYMWTRAATTEHSAADGAETAAADNAGEPSVDKKMPSHHELYMG